MNPTDPAFPYHQDYDYPGINIRLFVATHLMQGLLAFPLMSQVQPHERILSFPDLARQAFEAADALLENEKPKP